jgi:hypothetical protein
MLAMWWGMMIAMIAALGGAGNPHLCARSAPRRAAAAERERRGSERGGSNRGGSNCVVRGRYVVA